MQYIPRFARRYAYILTTVLAFACGGPYNSETKGIVETAPTPTPYVMSLSERCGDPQRMVELVNAHRQANRRRALREDASLARVAQIRSDDMASHDYFGHTSPDGVTAFTLMGDSGISYQMAGENIARNEFKKALDVAFQGFRKSHGHNGNMLDALFGRIGVGIAYSRDGLCYYTQIFAD